MSHKCARCGDELWGSTGSFFDDSRICLDCDQIERAHPGFHKARKAEEEQVRMGNYNFGGVGVPKDLLKQCLEAKRART